MLVLMTSAMQPLFGSKSTMRPGSGGERPGPPSQQVRDAVFLSEKTAGLYGYQQAHEALNTEAGHIRSQDAGLQEVVHHVRKMTDDIRAFRKNFPPFPQGSEERERLLNSFSAIRKQIARLTIPPEAAEKAANSQRTAPETAVMSMAGSFDHLFAAIRERMPAFPADTSDRSFDALVKKLESLLDFVQKKRATVEQQVFSTTYNKSNGDGELSLEMAALSIRMGRMFSGQADWQMTMSQVHLKALQV